MRGIVATAGVLAALASGGVAGAQGGAILRVLDTAPMTVRGTGFRPAEHVTLTLTASGATRVRHPTAGAAGRFVAVFGGVTIGHCRGYFLRATGDRGSRAVFRFIPECPQP